MSLKTLFFGLTILLFASCATHKVDVLVVGGGASGTTAGLQAARLGANTLIVEETTWLGGMLTSAGVAAVDGNYNLPSGIFGEFRDSLVAYYGSADALKTGWVSNVLFEPKVGNDILQAMVANTAKLDAWFETSFVSATKKGKNWEVIVMKDGKEQKVVAKVLIDATELGDVAKHCGVGYDIGMEARSVCKEDIAPEVANGIIQDLTYVMILKDYGVDKTIAMPEGYDASLFYCTAQSDNCVNPKPGQAVWSADQMIRYGKLPNNRYMINWPIEGNDYYLDIIEMTADERKLALEKAKHFSLCYLYYMQTELGFNNFGLDEDQFPTDDNFPMIPYHRESRRIHGMVRFNVNHVAKPFEQPEALYRTGVGVGDYPIDHHHKRNPKWAELPELHFYPVPSYNVPLGALVPKDIDNLIVAEKSISVSNLLNGSTRLQPVVLQIGQAAGALAALSLTTGSTQNTSVRLVQNTLLENGVYLLPYLDLKKDDPHFAALQRIGSTGILKGKGMNVGWSNQTWFQADSVLTASELVGGMKDFEPAIALDLNNEKVTVEEALVALNTILTYYKKDNIDTNNAVTIWNELQLTNFALNRYISKKEFAVLLDAKLQAFTLKDVDMKGQFK